VFTEQCGLTGFVQTPRLHDPERHNEQ
jgi:hypothetical protein